jgi:hypothetical protein
VEGSGLGWKEVSVEEEDRDRSDDEVERRWEERGGGGSATEGAECRRGEEGDKGEWEKVGASAVLEEMRGEGGMERLGITGEEAAWGRICRLVEGEEGGAEGRRMALTSGVNGCLEEEGEEEEEEGEEGEEGEEEEERRDGRIDGGTEGEESCFWWWVFCFLSFRAEEGEEAGEGKEVEVGVEIEESFGRTTWWGGREGTGDKTVEEEEEEGEGVVREGEEWRSRVRSLALRSLKEEGGGRGGENWRVNCRSACAEGEVKAEGEIIGEGETRGEETEGEEGSKGNEGGKRWELTVAGGGEGGGEIEDVLEDGDNEDCWLEEREVERGDKESEDWEGVREELDKDKKEGVEDRGEEGLEENDFEDSAFTLELCSVPQIKVRIWGGGGGVGSRQERSRA